MRLKPRLPPNLYQQIYAVTDQYIIGDRCPCDRCSSNVKFRTWAFLVGTAAVVSAATTVFLLGSPSTEEARAAGSTGLAAFTVWLLSDPVTECINDEMPVVCPNTGIVVDEKAEVFEG